MSTDSRSLLSLRVLVVAADAILAGMKEGHLTPDEAVEAWNRERKRISECSYVHPERGCVSVRCSCRERVEALRYG